MRTQMTKNMVFAEIAQVNELAKVVRRLTNEIASDIGGNAAEELLAMINGNQTLDNTIKRIKLIRGFNERMDGVDVILPSIDVRNCGTKVLLTCDMHDDNHSMLDVCIQSGDVGASPQASIGYTLHKGQTDEFPIDLAMVEIKKGDLAESNQLPKDNADIDIYLWQDPYTTEFTDMHRIKCADIIAAFRECEE